MSIDLGAIKARKAKAGAKGLGRACVEWMTLIYDDVPALVAEVERLQGERDLLVNVVSDYAKGTHSRYQAADALDALVAEHQP